MFSCHKSNIIVNLICLKIVLALCKITYLMILG